MSTNTSRDLEAAPDPALETTGTRAARGKSRHPAFRVAVFGGALVAAFAAGMLYRDRPVPPVVSARDHRILYYHDPMHPEYKSDKPGIAPDCGMDLEPVYADASNNEFPRNTPSPTTIAIAADRQPPVGIVSEVVESTPFVHTIRTVGRVVPDETRIYRMISGADGWVRQIFPTVTGTLVHAGDLLGIYYGRDYQAAEQSYIYALKNQENGQLTASGPTTVEAIEAQVDTARENLLAMGFSELQVRQLARTRETTRNIELRAPITGFVLANNVYAGLRFDRGMELVRLADLAHVWVAADLFQYEREHLKPGAKAKIVVPNQRTALAGSVANTLPQFDSTSRTMKLRVEADNPGFVLRPGMFVDVELPVTLAASVHVPVDAVIDSGVRKTVYIDHGNGKYSARAVQTGWHFGDRVQIVSGLSAGDRVVRSGAFLLDSETRMKGELTAKSDPAATVADPVCGMRIHRGSHFADYRGKQVYFCSEKCKQAFEADKEGYAGAAQSQ